MLQSCLENFRMPVNQLGYSGAITVASGSSSSLSTSDSVKSVIGAKLAIHLKANQPVRIQLKKCAMTNEPWGQQWCFFVMRCGEIQAQTNYYFDPNQYSQITEKRIPRMPYDECCFAQTLPSKHWMHPNWKLSKIQKMLQVPTIHFVNNSVAKLPNNKTLIHNIQLRSQQTPNHYPQLMVIDPQHTAFQQVLKSLPPLKVILSVDEASILNSWLNGLNMLTCATWCGLWTSPKATKQQSSSTTEILNNQYQLCRYTRMGVRKEIETYQKLCKSIYIFFSCCAHARMSNPCLGTISCK